MLRPGPILEVNHEFPPQELRMSTLLVLPLFLFPLVENANILIAPALGGSHTTVLYEIAVLLGNAGHNITFANIDHGKFMLIKY